MEVQLIWNSDTVSTQRSSAIKNELFSNNKLFFRPECETFWFFSDLTMEIVRYRLIGPQSHTVLAETLEAATDCDVSVIISSTELAPG